MKAENNFNNTNFYSKTTFRNYKTSGQEYSKLGPDRYALQHTRTPGYEVDE